MVICPWVMSCFRYPRLLTSYRRANFIRSRQGDAILMIAAYRQHTMTHTRLPLLSGRLDDVHEQ